MKTLDNFKCDFCNTDTDILYEGYFRTSAIFNPYAKGTASEGIIQLRRACKDCTKIAIDTGLACAKSLPIER